MQTLSNINSNIIWHADPVYFNDPYDSGLEVEYDKITPHAIIILANRSITASGYSLFIEEMRKLKKKAIPHEEAVDVSRKALQKRNGVACFSETFDNLLMWGHYGAAHTGICLEYDTKYEPFSKAKAVVYTESYRTFEVAELLKDHSDQLLKLLLTKSKCWEYEKEWRTVSSDCNKAVVHPNEALVGIHFGTKMDESHKTVIRNMLSNYIHLQYYQMVLSDKGFQLGRIPIS
jgi:hypothetical protein